MNRFRKKLKSVNFGPETDPFTPFYPFLMPVIRYNFRKMKLADSEKSSKKLILRPKMPHFSHFRQNKIFP